MTHPDRDGLSRVPGRNHTCRQSRNNCAENFPQLHDVIGHDQDGHRVAGALIHHAITTPEALRARDPQDLLLLRNVGQRGLRVLQERGVLGHRVGHRALVYLATAHDRASLAEFDRLKALTAHARAQDLDIIGVVLENAHHNADERRTPQWRAALREIDGGTLDTIVTWDPATGQPTAWPAGTGR
ncbi:hypothetical protein [Streptomyces sp. NPDC059994]|uniref:hypothetical protein n=1 Tax=Streptomyces sp. NPDC059994 TaxID=3347029 RepID=UPI0036738856